MRTISDIEHLFPGAAENGLSSAAAAQSVHQFGANKLTPLPREPVWKKFLEKFDEPIIKILLAAALLSMIVDLFRPPAESGRYLAGGVAIGLAVLAVVGAYLVRRAQWVPTILFVAALVLWPVGLATGHAS